LATIFFGGFPHTSALPPVALNTCESHGPNHAYKYNSQQPMPMNILLLSGGLPSQQHVGLFPRLSQMLKE
jgi:hypothetical protein